jgi:hypothetical protein
MASNPSLDTRVSDAVGAAISQLMTTRSWGDSTFVTLPVFYPNGTPVTVKVEPSQVGFRVSDGGLTFRHLEQIGAEHYFARNAPSFANEIEGFVYNRSICLDVTVGELAAAIADIADTTARMASKIIGRVGRKGEAQIADHLYDRLKAVFGAGRVERDVHLVGPSTKDWDVDSIVHLDGGDAIFQAVSNHHASVYSTSAMFHDLALKDRPPVTTAVVQSRQELGAWFNILAQAGNVIEQADPNLVYERATAWHV